MAAALVVATLITAAFVARRSGVDGPMLQRVHLVLAWLAAPLFLLIMAARELLHLPGTAFIIVARLVFGPGGDFVLGYAGAVFAVSVSFLVARQLVAADFVAEPVRAARRQRSVVRQQHVLQRRVRQGDGNVFGWI